MMVVESCPCEPAGGGQRSATMGVRGIDREKRNSSVADRVSVARLAADLL